MGVLINEAAISELQMLNDERQRIVECVRRWGGLASDAVLDPACCYFSLPSIDGFIAYREEFGCAVVFGDPVCAQSDIPHLTRAFHQACRKRRQRVVYITVSQQFAQWALQNVCGVAMEFGEELMLDPHNDPRARTGVNASLVRRKVRHAIKEGVTAAEYLENDNIELETAIERVGEAWLQARQGPQVYISRVRLFSDRWGKRWLYAQKEGQTVGVLLLNRLDARQGWLLNRVMISPEAPNGTPELLVTLALETLAAERCHFVTFGVVPAQVLGEIIGLGKFGSSISRCTYKLARKIFYLGGTKKFWEKFHPESQPSYLLFSEQGIGIRDVIGLARAMNVSF